MIFQKENIEPILSGEKEYTIRKGDRTKQLKPGHIYKCKINRYKKEFFANIKIISVDVKKFDELTEEDAKNDLFKDLEECKARLIQLNKEEITRGQVSVIHFKVQKGEIKKRVIKTLKISDLKTTEYNPRKITKQELKKLETSIREFGFVVPIVVNQHPERINVVLSGHQRLKVAQGMGLKELPCMIVELDITKERALNLALNKISGEFEEDKLTEALLKIEEENEDLLSLTGFSTEEVNYLLGLREKEKEKIFAQSLEDDYVIGNTHGIEPGDIVILDKKHKIICGDSTDPNTFRKLFGEKKIDLLVTSPPYNLDIDYGKYKDNKIYKEYIELIRSVFKISKDFLNRGRFLCINIGREWGPINMPAKYDNIMDALGYVFFRNIYWSKPLGSARATTTSRNPFPRYYIPKVQTEIIEIFSNEEDPKIYDHMITYKFKEDQRIKKQPIPQILLSKYSGNVWEMMTETTLGAEHPAPFPVQLPFNCIRFFSFEDEIVLDPFLGSGTTILAADQLNRKGYGIEIDPDYVSLAIDRYLIYRPTAKFEIVKGNAKEEAK